MKKKFQRNVVLTLLALMIGCFSSEATAGPNKVVATINTGVNPVDMAITPDSRYGYIANSNNYFIPGEDSVIVVDLKQNLPIQTITSDTFDGPFAVTINNAGTKAYVANSNGSAVTIIDISTNTVIGAINGFDGPSGIVITPDDRYGYVNNYGGPNGVGIGNGTTVSVVDLNTQNIITTIVVGLAPAALAISPCGKYVYSVNYVDGNPGNGSLTTIKTSSNSVINTLGGLFGPYGIALTPDGKRAYVTNFGSNNFAPFGSTVSVIDLKSHTIVADIDMGIQPAGIAITPNGKYAYVSNYNSLYSNASFDPNNLTLAPGQGTVNVIDIRSNKVIPPTIPTGESPAALVIAPNGKKAYVVNFTSNTVEVISLR